MEKIRAIVDPSLVEGINVLIKDPLAQGVLRQVVRGLSVHEYEVAIKLKELRTDVLERLELLTEKGLVIRHEGEQGSFTLFSPSEIGLRIYRGLSSF